MADILKPKYGVAGRVLAKLGGVPYVARRLNRTPVTLYRWGYPKTKGGTDGLIPADYHHDLLRIAREDGKILLPDDFFDSPLPLPPPSGASPC